MCSRLVFVGLLVGSGAWAQSESLVQRATVSKTDVNVRQSPSAAAPRGPRKLQKGDLLDVRQATPEWFRIEFPADLKGQFVHRSLVDTPVVAPPPPPPAPAPKPEPSIVARPQLTLRGTVAKDEVNVRKSPSVKGLRGPQRLKRGTLVELVDAHAEWFQIETPAAFQGLYVSKQMVDLVTPIPEVAAVVAPPVPPPAPVVPAKRASDPVGVAVPSGLLTFRGSALWAKQDGRSSYTLLGSWNPSMELAEGLNTGVQLAVSALKSENGSSFLVAGYAAHIENVWHPQFSTEFIAGAQTWFRKKKLTKFMLGVGGSYLFPERPYGVVDRVFLNYTPVFQKIIVHEWRAGVGVKF